MLTALPFALFRPSSWAYANCVWVCLLPSLKKEVYNLNKVYLGSYILCISEKTQNEAQRNISCACFVASGLAGELTSDVCEFEKKKSHFSEQQCERRRRPRWHLLWSRKWSKKKKSFQCPPGGYGKRIVSCSLACFTCVAACQYFNACLF